MRRTLAACLCVAAVAAGPTFAQADMAAPGQQAPIPVPDDAPAGSSGPSSVSSKLGSGALALVGLVVVVLVGAVAVAAND